ncbi:M13 family metallopeptidase [Flavobacterium orientale]|uniref:Endothelin-converting protein n=1 Tax=Flavobacterium orientale TaxID=1756020 RepID=A0A916XYC0_9FLAO|nr:M13 family metallopeptidase [Flavobacterium orientale]GGD21723.1 endothelin-converting protein [Flavobacterium orientale]
MKNKINQKMMLAIVAVGFFSAAFSQESKKSNPGINLEFMDTKVKPGDDFFRYVNGTWFDKTEIPADRTRWGSFDELREKTDKDMVSILNEALKNPKYTDDTDQGKALNLYRSIMDTVSRDKQGIKPLKPFLDKINAVKSVADLQKLMIEMDNQGGIGFFGVSVGTDAKNSNRNLVNVGLGSLGLPDRDYYLSDEADSKEKREKYVAHVARMLQYLGESPAQAKASAERVLALEKALATPRLDRVERRDRRKTYNPMTVADLQALTPSVNWNEYITKIGLPKIDTLIVSQPRYMTALETIFKENKVEDWKAYMRWTLLNRSAGTLSTEIEYANWEFYGKTLTGALKPRPRNERALQSVNGPFGEALGKIYVEKMFPPEAKEKAQKMIKNVFLAFENRINNLPWMAPSTKVNAIEKLRKSNVKIGYPDKWKDYSKVTIVAPNKGGTYFDNGKAISKWRTAENYAKLNKPVDKTEWFMSPQTVNAYYNASFNEIVFPAAILQPPFYDFKADEAVNYGGIGAVIGHEISHGFDDSGSRYNADGNLVNWWSDEDLKMFTELGGALAEQYSQLEPIPGIFVDGKFTLGENIGDLGGVNAAYDGLKIHLKESGNPGLIDGFTPEQRFFISWATIWRSKARDEAIKNLVKTDTHSPGMYRAYVPLQNVDSFYEAFDIKEDQKLYLKPEDRVRIW